MTAYIDSFSPPTTLVIAVINNTCTERARCSISDVHCSTTKGTSSCLSRVIAERSTPNTVPFLCSHSSWHDSIHFLCRASPHCRRSRLKEWMTRSPLISIFCYSLSLHVIPARIQCHWQLCSFRIACIWPFCSSSSWVGVLVQLVTACVLSQTDCRCTLSWKHMKDISLSGQLANILFAEPLK